MGIEILKRAEKWNSKTYWRVLQDGEGDGMKSREGIPVTHYDFFIYKFVFHENNTKQVTHYDEQLKEEVVAFAKATSQKEARDRLIWVMCSNIDVDGTL